MSERIISKQCSKCKAIKPISEFYKHTKTKDLHFSKCKACCTKYIIQYRKTKKGKAADKRYKQSEKGKAKEEHYKQSEKGKATQKRYEQGENYKAKQKRYKQSEKGKTIVKCYKICHPERVKAINTVNSAIRAGRLPRPDSLPCHYCPAQAKEYHHYKGYAPEHWLDVVPACIKCHNKIPKKQVISATA